MLNAIFSFILKLIGVVAGTFIGLILMLVLVILGLAASAEMLIN